MDERIQINGWFIQYQWDKNWPVIIYDNNRHGIKWMNQGNEEDKNKRWVRMNKMRE